MKKWVVILLLMFPFTVYAEDSKLEVKELKTNITVMDTFSYMYEETVKINPDYSTDLNTRYYIKKIPKKLIYTYKEINKTVNYDIEATMIDVVYDYYNIDYNDKKNYIISVGADTMLLNANEEIKTSYLLEYKSKNLITNREYHFDIARSEYDLNNISFEVNLTDNAARGKILFTINGKDYFNKMDGLEYSLVNGYVLRGTYNKILPKGNELSAKIIIDEKDRKIKLDSREIVVYCSFGVIIVFIIFIIYKIINHKKEK